MDRTEQLIETLPYWDKLSEAERETVRQSAAINRFERGALLVGGCRDCMGMLLVQKGCLRAYLLSEEGREISLFRLSEGDSCVLSASCVISRITFDTYIVAEEDCELLVVPSGVFGRLSEENIYVRCFMYELMTERFSSVVRAMEGILFHGFDRRLAAFLLSECHRTGENTVRMTHEQIAQNTSSAREVVARMLKRFASDGIVSVKRGEVLLTDREALAALAGEDTPEM